MTTTSQARPVDEREARQVAEAARDTEWQAPSFAKELYLGRFRLDLIHPHPRQSPDDDAHSEKFLTELRNVCENELDGAVIEREAVIPDEYVSTLARLGVFGMKIPEEYGGAGADALATCIVIEEVARACASTSLIPAVNKLGTLPLLLAGSEELKRRYLPPVARGEAMFSYGLSEREAGSDTASMKTRAVRDGDGWVLSGPGWWCSAC